MRSFSLLIFLALLLPVTSFASEITIRPFLIDKTMVPRESASEIISLTSSYPNRKSVIYATVNEISVDSTGEIKEFITPVMTDRTTAVTSWVEIGRGRIELMPGQTVEIPLDIKVHPYAEPGEYHLFIGFVETSKRFKAEEVALAGDANGVIVKITVGDEREDSMRITSMTVDRFVTDGDKQQVEITVENAGEIASAPVGELIFYDSRGREITAVPVNSESVQISPGVSKTFSATIPITENLGRFKANVNLTYGKNQRANLYDTTGFYMVPLLYLFALAGLFLLFFVVLLVLLRRSMITGQPEESGDDIPLYVRDGHKPNPQDHDIHIK